MPNRLRLSAVAWTALALVQLTATPATAQDTSRVTTVDLPLLELPYNAAHGGRGPGMQQSLAFTAGFYELTHSALGRIASRHPNWTKAGILLFDYFAAAVPLADAWLHEEWHRAVLGHRAIGSRNDVWNLGNVFAEAISVSHVTDEDLIRFKRDHPADFVRTKAAGIEAEAELITRLEREQFFSGTKTWHTGLYWLIALNTQLYVGAVVSPEDSAEVDRLTDEANMEERTILERDVSGHDFTAGVYHLFRPEEPFEARGPHPSGVGLDRYIKVADLTEEEKRFLKREGRLSWLNLADPNFLGIRGLSFTNPLNGREARANVWLRHMLTSFGHTIDAHLVYQQEDTRFHLIAHRFTNHERSFPGVRAEAVDIPVTLGSRELAISPRAGIWSQPRGQQFMTGDGSLGGLAGMRVATRGGSRLQFYADAEVKSAGWVAGRVSLEKSATFHTGLSYRLNAR